MQSKLRRALPLIALHRNDTLTEKPEKAQIELRALGDPKHRSGGVKFLLFFLIPNWSATGGLSSSAWSS
jgi:hypothetical protein